MNPAAIRIGDHVDVGPRVLMTTGSHKVDPSGSHIAGDGISQDITIGSGSWLGAASTILPNVTLPPKTLVAAGSVVTASVSTPCSLLAGVPAAVKKTY